MTARARQRMAKASAPRRVMVASECGVKVCAPLNGRAYTLNCHLLKVSCVRAFFACARDTIRRCVDLKGSRVLHPFNVARLLRVLLLYRERASIARRGAGLTCRSLSGSVVVRQFKRVRAPLVKVARVQFYMTSMFCKMECHSTVVCNRYLAECFVNCPVSLVVRPVGFAEAAPQKSCHMVRKDTNLKTNK